MSTGGGEVTVNLMRSHVAYACRSVHETNLRFLIYSVTLIRDDYRNVNANPQIVT